MDAVRRQKGFRMIYRKEEYLQDDSDDSQFPIKQIDCLQEVNGPGKRFIGHAALNIETPAGVQQTPVPFEIKADSIEAAFKVYADSAKPKLDETRQHVQQWLEEMRRQYQNKIVTPGQPTGGPGIIDFDNLKNRR